MTSRCRLVPDPVGKIEQHSSPQHLTMRCAARPRNPLQHLALGR